MISPGYFQYFVISPGYFQYFVISPGYFQEDGKGCFSLKDLTDTLEKLRGDPDRDVRYFAGGQMADIPLRQLLLSHERQDSESHDSEFQDASEYLENDLINLELEGSSSFLETDKFSKQTHSCCTHGTIQNKLC